MITKNAVIMARPIKETPTLRGEDARIFEKKIANPKPVSREDILATQDVYDKIISIENFPFNDINLFKST